MQDRAILALALDSIWNLALKKSTYRRVYFPQIFHLDTFFKTIFVSICSHEACKPLDRSSYAIFCTKLDRPPDIKLIPLSIITVWVQSSVKFSPVSYKWELVLQRNLNIGTKELDSRRYLDKGEANLIEMSRLIFLVRTAELQPKKTCMRVCPKYM